MERKMGKELGSGGTSTVYEWGDNDVIKIYKPHVPEDVIQNEMFIGRLLNKFSLKLPRFIGSVDIEGRKALIYEIVEGKVFADPIINGIYETGLAYKFAHMHYDIHRITIDGLPSQYTFLKNRILELNNMPGDKTSHLLKLLEGIPDDNKLCHSDYQPLNIIGNTDKYAVIDWNGACSGNPVFDVAWSYMTLHSPVIKHLTGELAAETFITFAGDYLSCYCGFAGIREDQILKCLPITAARRLYDNNLNDNDISRQEQDWLSDMIMRG